jgi:hypothetical protein
MRRFKGRIGNKQTPKKHLTDNVINAARSKEMSPKVV